MVVTITSVGMQVATGVPLLPLGATVVSTHVRDVIVDTVGDAVVVLSEKLVVKLCVTICSVLVKVAKVEHDCAGAAMGTGELQQANGQEPPVKIQKKKVQ